MGLLNTFFPKSLLLVYKNATDFSIFILCQAISLNLFIIPKRFLCGIFRDFYTLYFVTCIVTVLHLLSNWKSFISSSCLIAVARTSNTILNKFGDSGHLCLIPDF